MRTAAKKCYLLSLKTRVTYYRKLRASLRAFVKACRRSSLAACKACQRENRVGMGMAATRGWGDAGIAACGNRFDTGRRQRKNSGMRESRRREDAAARGQRRSVASKKQKRAAAKLRQLRELIYDQADSRACAAQRVRRCT